MVKRVDKDTKPKARGPSQVTTECVHWWVVESVATNNHYPACCKRCGAETGFPLHPNTHWIPAGHGTNEQRRQHWEYMVSLVKGGLWGPSTHVASRKDKV